MIRSMYSGPNTAEPGTFGVFLETSDGIFGKITGNDANAFDKSLSPP